MQQRTITAIEEAAGEQHASQQRDLRQETVPFQSPILRSALLQIATSFGGFAAVWVAMYAALDVSYWIFALLAPLGAFLLVRVFIIQHDCGHLSFFRSRRANDVLGHACSMLTQTPYLSWRRQHAGHHGVWNNLDRRQSGADIYSSCLTVAEYRSMATRQRWCYRITRHPLVANVLLPPLIFILLYRLPFDMPKAWRLERRNVHLTSLALVAMFAALGLALGHGRVAAVQVPVQCLAAVIGVWLFSVQHRGEQTRWARQADWDPIDAALRGSTHLRLPAVLHWMTGNIGLHHIHHLNPRVPNYRLQDCGERVAALCDVPSMSLWQSMRALRLALWDEDQDKMVSFAEAGGVPVELRSSNGKIASS